MPSEILFMVEESLESGYAARALGHSIYPEGETIEEIGEGVREAVHYHFDEAETPRLSVFTSSKKS